VKFTQNPAFLMMVLAELESKKCHSYENGNDEIIDYNQLCEDEDTYFGKSVSVNAAKNIKMPKMHLFTVLPILQVVL